MLKTWSELYTTFARLAAMVPNAEANVCCEELCDRILTSGVEEILRVSFSMLEMTGFSLLWEKSWDFTIREKSRF